MKLDLVIEILKKHHANRDRLELPYLDYQKIVNARDTVIQRFRPEFSNPELLSAETFRAFLHFANNQHWTGLQRPTKHSTEDMPKLRDALKYLLDEELPIAMRLDALIGSGPKSVPGVSVGILTPILLVRYPHKYGVWNSKSESALKTLKIWPEFKRGMTEGTKYELLNAQYQKISELADVDLWCLDGLWHVINEKCRLDRDEAFADLENDEKQYFEGKRIETHGYRFERDTKARDECIKTKGLDCVVCGFNFAEMFGELGLGFIHVHHLVDLAHTAEEGPVDPKADLVPVCPNCHAMLHKGATPARSIEDLKKIIRHSAGH